jgi:hypothetical protein
MDKVARIRRELESHLREVVRLSQASGRSLDGARALAELGSLVAAENPQEAIEISKKALVLAGDDEERKAFITDALHIAYRALGDGVRAAQNRAIAIRLRGQIRARTGRQNQPTWQELMSAMRAHSTPLAGSETYAIELDEPLDSWLAAKSQISLQDLAPAFGEFVSNYREFYRQASDLLSMVVRRLEAQLSKPDNYLLLADPGSGKSFFVKQFKTQLQSALGADAAYLERNLSAYTSIDEAFKDIALDVIVALLALDKNQTVLLFVDEVDSQLNGQSMFQRLIAPMYGDPFFFLQKQVSFAKKNLVVFYALSGKAEDIQNTPKWPDFLSRIPSAHQITLPKFESPVDRIYRAVAFLPKGAFKVTRVQAVALLYIGLQNCASVRELEQALEQAKARITSVPPVLELGHVATSPQDVDDLANETKFDIFAGPTNVIEIT